MSNQGLAFAEAADNNEELVRGIRKSNFDRLRCFNGADTKGIATFDTAPDQHLLTLYFGKNPGQYDGVWHANDRVLAAKLVKDLKAAIGFEPDIAGYQTRYRERSVSNKLHLVGQKPELNIEVNVKFPEGTTHTLSFGLAPEEVVAVGTAYEGGLEALEQVFAKWHITAVDIGTEQYDVAVKNDILRGRNDNVRKVMSATI